MSLRQVTVEENDTEAMESERDSDDDLEEEIDNIMDHVFGELDMENSYSGYGEANGEDTDADRSDDNISMDV